MAEQAILELGKFRLDYSEPLIMGILNITPDSFSGDGLYKYSSSIILKKAMQMQDDGADIIDIGGESSRPYALPVSLKEELKRTIPIIKKLSKKLSIPISIDTYKPETAKQALDNGASIVNDITALGAGLEMAKIIKQFNAAVILMHMQGRPQNMQKNPKYKSIISDITSYLKKSIDFAVNNGISRKKIIIDPGIGFGKTADDNLKIINNLNLFSSLKQPIMVGISRKSFIGKILNLEVQDRLIGTIAAQCIAILKGANILRVHDVKKTKETLDICQAILHS